jgi:hypothetical protein
MEVSLKGERDQSTVPLMFSTWQNLHNPATGSHFNAITPTHASTKTMDALLAEKPEHAQGILDNIRNVIVYLAFRAIFVTNMSFPEFMTACESDGTEVKAARFLGLLPDTFMDMVTRGDSYTPPPPDELGNVYHP